MDTQIICPSCKKPIPLTEALSHEVEEKYKRLNEEKIEKIRQDARKWKTEEEIRLKEVLRKENELNIEDTKNAKEEAEKKNKELLLQVLELTKSIRQLKAHDEEREIQMQKKLAEGEDQIKRKAKEQADQEYSLKLAESDKKVQDALKLAEEWKRKVEQGSQQSQGEVLELQVGELLRREFPMDTIADVPKGKLGADLIQTVNSRSGTSCGQIVWELKRTKSWVQEWIPKLKEDQRQVKADFAAIISEVLPPDIKLFGSRDTVVWIGNYQSIIGLAKILRKCLLSVALVKSTSSGKKEKMEIMWEYLTSVEFKQKVESIIETFSSMQKNIDGERTYFNRKWERDEKMIQRVINNTAGMYGSLESIMGKALPEVAGFSLDLDPLFSTYEDSK